MLTLGLRPVKLRKKRTQVASKLSLTVLESVIISISHVAHRVTEIRLMAATVSDFEVDTRARRIVSRRN